jgi:hypothetical protein
MKTLKRIVLGSLLFLTLVLFGACANETTTVEGTSNQTTTTAETSTTVEGTSNQTTTTAETSTTVEANRITVEIILSEDNPNTSEVETEYVATSKVITFTEDDNLLDLLMENFTVYCADESGNPDETCSYDGSFGKYLVGIDVLDSTAVTNGYISFYIDGDYAMTGVDATPLEDGKVYSFKLETY